MRQREQERFATFSNVLRFCEQYKEGLQPISPGFEQQVDVLRASVTKLGESARRQASGEDRAVVPHLREAKRALYQELVLIHRLARVVRQHAHMLPLPAIGWEQSATPMLLQGARGTAREARRLENVFLSCGASVDFLSRLHLAIEKLERVQAARRDSQSERRSMRIAEKMALMKGGGAIVCLDAVVRAYYKGDAVRRAGVWRQWQLLVPRVQAPYLRTRRRV